MLAEENISAILIHVQNGRRYPYESPGRAILDVMDPFRIGLFPTAKRGNQEIDFLDAESTVGVIVKPVIRMVFALAALESTPPIVLLSPPTRRRHYGSFTAYDIWCAGVTVTERTFRAITKAHETMTYRTLFNRDIHTIQDSHTFGQNPEDDRVEHMRRAMHAGASENPAHYVNFFSAQPSS